MMGGARGLSICTPHFLSWKEQMIGEQHGRSLRKAASGKPPGERIQNRRPGNSPGSWVVRGHRLISVMPDDGNPGRAVFTFEQDVRLAETTTDYLSNAVAPVRSYSTGPFQNFAPCPRCAVW
jgi:hypothetical protein